MTRGFDLDDIGLESIVTWWFDVGDTVVISISSLLFPLLECRVSHTSGVGSVVDGSWQLAVGRWQMATDHRRDGTFSNLANISSHPSLSLG